MDIIRRSPVGLTLKIIAIEVLIEISYLLISSVLTEAREQIGALYPTIRLTTTLIFMSIGISAVVIMVSQWANEGYYLKDNELTVRRGIIGKTEVSYPYANMQSVTVQQSFFGRVFNFGQISILIPTLGKEVMFNEISNPQGFANKLKEHIPYPDNGQFIIRR